MRKYVISSNNLKLFLLLFLVISKKHLFTYYFTNKDQFGIRNALQNSKNISVKIACPKLLKM